MQMFAQILNTCLIRYVTILNAIFNLVTLGFQNYREYTMQFCQRSLQKIRLQRKDTNDNLICSFNLSNGNYILCRTQDTICSWISHFRRDLSVYRLDITRLSAIKSRLRSAARERKSKKKGGDSPRAAYESTSTLYSDKMILSIVNALAGR